MTEILPCVFCAKEPKTLEDEIKCCGFQVYSHSKHGTATELESESDIIYRWNLLQQLFRIAEREIESAYIDQLKEADNEATKTDAG